MGFFMKNLVNTLLKEKKLSKKKIESIKRSWSRETKNKMPLNSEIWSVLNEEEQHKLRPFLNTKPVRNLAGVSVIAIMPKPNGCPARCTFCPEGKNAPKSYTGFEPSTMRSMRNNYDSFKIVSERINSLSKTGHITDKNELIVQGGTFPSYDWDYQKEFIKGAFDGFNGKVSKSLSEAKKINETTENRCIGLTIETRPDWIFTDKFLELGCTRIEMGLQAPYDDVLNAVNRGHSVQDFKDAVKELKEAGFKILYHLMPGLPNSTLERDLKAIDMIFEDEEFKPDMFKIYPTLVMPNTELYDQWKSGDYEPKDEEYYSKIIDYAYKKSPKWVRLMRVQRDIPSQHIGAGPKKGNLREIVENKLIKEDHPIKEIRFRESGQVYKRKKITPKNVKLFVEKYRASGGDEYFISAEDSENDILLGFCRLRLGERSEAMIRELHVYGSVTEIGEDGKDTQHKGWGSKLLKEAEKIAKNHGRKEMLVISGVGVREYYKNVHGYKLKDHYMWKEL